MPEAENSGEEFKSQRVSVWGMGYAIRRCQGCGRIRPVLDGTIQARCLECGREL